jgi:ligand-binding sensor domain-containing protein/putative methionine-R-sulfoxide reductase with GAF domain
MNRTLLLLSAILFFAAASLAQPLQGHNFARYTTADGLSSNMVTGIAEDSAGFLWMATRSGLNRFNGNRFVQYHSTDDPKSLPGDELMSLYRLDDHRLAVVGSGVHIVDTRNGLHKNLFIPYKDQRYAFKFNMTIQATGDREGNVFVLSRSGFYQFADNDSLVYRFDYYPDSLIAVKHLVFGGKILELDDHRLLIVSIDGLFVYDKRNKGFRKLRHDDFPPLADFLSYPRVPFEFFQLKPGIFFIYDPVKRLISYIDLHKRRMNILSAAWPKGLNEVGWRSRLIGIDSLTFLVTLQQSGLVRISFDRNKEKPPAISPVSELSEYVCNDILNDHGNRLIIATNKGLLRQQVYPPNVQTGDITGHVELADASFDDVIPLANKVYAATHGAGLAVFSKSDLRFEKLIGFSNPLTNNISSLLLMPDKSILVGSAYTPLIFSPRTGNSMQLTPPGWIKSRYWVHNINRDSKDNIWISAHRIYRFKIATHSFDLLPDLPKLLDAPVAIEEDKEGNIWMARHGLARFNIALQKYDRYIDSFPFIKIPDKQVDIFTIDRNNTIWIGVHNNGLIAYSPISGSFRHFTKKNGLANDQVSSLYNLNDKLWIASYTGISSIDIENFSVRNYGPQDGFPISPVNRGSRFYYDSTDHLLYIGFADAIARFDPSVMAASVAAPRVFIESVVVDGKQALYLPGTQISTSWNDRQLHITIGNINFFDGYTQRFAYRFVNNGNDPWIELGKETSFSVSGLSQGHHRLEVRVSSSSNRWPAQFINLDIIVAAPFWLRPWFFALCGLIILWLVYLLVRWRTSVARRKEMVNTQIEKLRAEDYKAQFELEQITHYFSSSLAGKKTEEDILSDVAARLIGRMNYEECIIYLWNRDKTKMVQRAAHGPKGQDGFIQTADFEVKPGQGIVGHVINTKKPLLVSDTRKDPRYRVDDCFRLSELTVPIIHNDELLGVIDSEHSQPNYFNERDIKIMTTIATLLGNKLKQLESEQSLEAKQRELTSINQQLAEAKLSALQAQMNPHFVFNALNSIKRMILEGDNDTASRYLSKFALMIRMTLEHSRETFVTLQDNIQYLKAYLEMERLRFDHTFSYLINMDESIDDEEISFPTMMIQPIVENAIWHGLMSAETDKKLKICFTSSNNRVRCVVEDNGIGIRQSEKLRQKSRSVHRSVGLENLRKRVHIMNEKYRTDCTLSIIDLLEAGEQDPGTRVILELNISTA